MPVPARFSSVRTLNFKHVTTMCISGLEAGAALEQEMQSLSRAELEDVEPGLCDSERREARPMR